MRHEQYLNPWIIQLFSFKKVNKEFWPTLFLQAHPKPNSCGNIFFCVLIEHDDYTYAQKYIARCSGPIEQNFRSWWADL